MPAPVLYPATLEVDFTAIPLNQCAPVLDGLFVSHAGAASLLRSIRRDRQACALQAIDASKRDRDAAATITKLEAEQRELVPLKAWVTIGKLETAGIGTALFVGLLIAIIGAVKSAQAPNQAEVPQ